MWMIFEGLDKAGKTTLEWEVLKRTNFKVNVIDRGPVGYHVFDTLFGRATDEGEKEYARLIGKINTSDDFVVVYCRVDCKIALNRIEENNETCPYNYYDAQVLLEESIRELYNKSRVICIDTTNDSIEESASKIVEWFRRFEHER